MVVGNGPYVLMDSPWPWLLGATWRSQRIALMCFWEDESNKSCHGHLLVSNFSNLHTSASSSCLLLEVWCHERLNTRHHPSKRTWPHPLMFFLPLERLCLSYDAAMRCREGRRRPHWSIVSFYRKLDQVLVVFSLDLPVVMDALIRKNQLITSLIFQAFNVSWLLMPVRLKTGHWFSSL